MRVTATHRSTNVNFVLNGTIIKIVTNFRKSSYRPMPEGTSLNSDNRIFVPVGAIKLTAFTIYRVGQKTPVLFFIAIRWSTLN